MVKRLTMGVFAACLWGSAGVCSAQEIQTRVLSLAQCEALALEHSALVKGANAALDMAQAKKSEASHARFLPEMSLRSILTVVPRARAVFTPTGVLTSPDTAAGLSDLRPFTETTLDLVQPIWTGGKISRLNDAARFGVDAGEAQVDVKKAEVQLQVRELYWGLVLAKELVDVTNDALEEVTSAEDKLRQELDEGSDEVSQNDLFKFQIFKYETSKRHREALGKVELGKAALRAAIGLAESVDFDIETAELIPLEVTIDSLSVYAAAALTERADVAQFRAAQNVRRSLARAAHSDYYPQFFVAGQLKYNFAGDRFDSNNPFVYDPFNFFRKGIVLGLNWNVNFRQTRDRARIARAELAAVADLEASMLAAVGLDVKKAYMEVEQAEQNTTESTTALKASDNWLRAEAQTFDLGIGEVKDFIDAFRANIAMRAGHLQNLFELNIALARLSKAVGRDFYPN